MRPFIIIASVLASVAVSLPDVVRRQGKGACADVHILVARASGEGKGEGMIGGLSRAIKSAIKGADSEAVDYPAALAPYGSSEIKGVTAAKAQLTAYVQRCPNAKVVLLGYSQVTRFNILFRAWLTKVTRELTLWDLSSVVEEDTTARKQLADCQLLTSTLVLRLPQSSQMLAVMVRNSVCHKSICLIRVTVVAAVLMGDPRFTKGMPFNKGTAKGTGVSLNIFLIHGIFMLTQHNSNFHTSFLNKLPAQRTLSELLHIVTPMMNSAIVRLNYSD
jgi:hypothetical protein